VRVCVCGCLCVNSERMRESVHNRVRKRVCERERRERLWYKRNNLVCREFRRKRKTTGGTELTEKKIRKKII
jgi:hypothetical protein